MSTPHSLAPSPAAAPSVATHQRPAVVPFVSPVSEIQWAAWGANVISVINLIGIGVVAKWWAWFVLHGLYIFGPAFLVTSLFLSLFVHGARRSRSRLLAAVEQDRVRLIAAVEQQTTERDRLAIQRHMEDADRRLSEAWTPEAIKERVAIFLESAHFTHSAVPECALLLRWKVVSIVGIPHRVDFLGGRCDVLSMTNPNIQLGSLSIHPGPAEVFDGKLSPEELGMRGVGDKVIIDSANQATLRSAMAQSGVAKLAFVLKCNVWSNGSSIPIDVVVPPTLIELPSWIRT